MLEDSIAGCTVYFDERVIDTFSRQILNPRFAKRHNICRVLIYECSV